MKSKQVMIAAVAVVVALSCVEQSASALSVFVHNANIPLFGADVTYTARDLTIQYKYVFHRHLTYNTHNLELPLPDAFQDGDTVMVQLDNPGANYYQLSERATIGNDGMEVWFTVNP